MKGLCSSLRKECSDYSDKGENKMPVGFEAITSGASGFLKTFIYWAGYLVFALIMGVACFFFYYYSQFKIKMTYWPIFGNAQDGYSVDKPKKSRFKFSKNNTSWSMPFNKKTVEPFDSKYIYPGNNVYAFKYGDNYLPAKMNFEDVNKDGVINTIEPVPYYVKNWQLLELKQNEIEFSKKDFWSQNKTLIVTMFVAIGCLGLTAITVYYCLKTASSTAHEIQAVGNSFKQVVQTMGGAPR